MVHLVRPIYTSTEKPIPVAEVLSQIQEAHQYLVRHGVQALRTAQATEESAYWGTQIKRIRVQFADDDRPELIDTSIRDHNLTEVYNQCATIERLLDALQWANDTLLDYKVLRCHPTTSSQKSDSKSEIPDHDIVLVNSRGELARFEVSDVINSEADGNGKELKDLRSLGVLASTRPYNVIEKWPIGRLFLVVSAEFAKRLSKDRTPKQKLHYYYRNHSINDQTCIFEVLSANIAE